MLNESEISLLKLLAGLFVALLLVTLLMSWWDRTGRKVLTRWLSIRGWIEKDPARASLNRLKRISVFYAIAILFLVVFRLPSIIQVVTPEQANSPEALIKLQEDLYKIKEVIYVGLMINAFWFWEVYKTLKELVLEKSEKKLLDKTSKGNIAPIPRSEF